MPTFLCHLADIDFLVGRITLAAQGVRNQKLLGWSQSASSWLLHWRYSVE